MSKLTLRIRIASGFALVIGLVILMSLFTYQRIHGINASYYDLMNENLLKLELAQGAEMDIANEAVAMRRFNFTGDSSDITIFNDYREDADKKLAKLSELMNDSKSKKIIETIKLRKTEYEKIAESSFLAKQANDEVKVGDYMKQAGTPYKATIFSSEELIGVVKASVKNEQEKQDKESSDTEILLLVFNLIVAVVAASVAIITSRRIVRPLKKINEVANELATGDLTKEDVLVKSRDELGALAQSFNTMKSNINHLVKQIVVTTDQVAASSDEFTVSAEHSSMATRMVADNVSEVAKGAEKQVAGLESAVSIVGEMAASIQQISFNTIEVSGAAERTAKAAEMGQLTIDAAVAQMELVEETVSNSAEAVTNLGDQSKEIGQIVDTISGIAGQTNLLALNAAIEAARAGEQGRGFAVVADEVRKLAEQSQEATKKIEAIIHEIQNETEKAVEAMSRGVHEVKAGSEVVNSAGSVFNEIVTLVDGVSDQVREISTAIEQMAIGGQQIESSIRDIDTISKDTLAQTLSVTAATEEQSATMEQVAASSQALAKLADELRNTVSQFKI